LQVDQEYLALDFAVNIMMLEKCDTCDMQGIDRAIKAQEPNDIVILTAMHSPREL
jgi:hypothetical protein